MMEAFGVAVPRAPSGSAGSGSRDAKYQRCFLSRHSRLRTLCAIEEKPCSAQVLECPRCGGRMRTLAAIHPPEAIRKILDLLGLPSRALPIACALPDREIDEMADSLPGSEFLPPAITERGAVVGVKVGSSTFLLEDKDFLTAYYRLHERSVSNRDAKSDSSETRIRQEETDDSKEPRVNAAIPIAVRSGRSQILREWKLAIKVTARLLDVAGDNRLCDIA